MKISSITLSNFRCFGPTPITFSMDDLTALVGINGTGKTAVLHALNRMFGVSQPDRALTRDDFHIPRGTRIDSINEQELYIEVAVLFPELADESNTEHGIPDCFEHMLLDGQGTIPFCRIRLEGSWAHGPLPEGNIDQQLYWVTSTSINPTDQEKKILLANDRSKIQVVYVPANHDATKQLKNVSGTLLGRLLRAVNWSDQPRDLLKSVASTVSDAMHSEAAITRIHESLQESWKDLHTGPTFTEPRLRFASGDLDQVLKNVDMVFHPSDDGDEREISRLSDGLRSLFYFAIIDSIFEIEQKVIESASSDDDAFADPAAIHNLISQDRLEPAALTIFAIEEPENHLSPHLLGRIARLLQGISNHPFAQVVVSSHSTSILKRIDPQNVRHFRLREPEGTTLVNPILLPPEPDACKYIREAVLAYPELYFSKLVILGEGDSEEIVIPRVASDMGVDLDFNCISMVPLGGRHVNHLWKLLTDLDIPFVTLLDLDTEREGGGFGRIKYVCQQLLANGSVDRNQLLDVRTNSNKSSVLSDTELAEMHLWENDIDILSGWTLSLENYDVFFSSPLDLDFMMLSCFPGLYDGITPTRGGPRLTPKRAIEVVLGTTAIAKNYTDQEKDLLPKYSYLFLGKGKPYSHSLALSHAADGFITDNAPDVLKRMINRAHAKLSSDEA